MEQRDRPMRPGWRSYSLRSLMVLVTLIGIGLGVVTHRARQQRIAVEQIREASGHVLFAHQFDENGDADVDAEPSGPKWLRDAVGEDYFRTLVYVELISDQKILLRTGRSKVNDEVMSDFSRVSGITRLELEGNPRITDESLRHLQHLRQLREMSMNHANIEGSGLRYLLGSRNLERLFLDHTPLTDEGLRYLGQLPNLKFLRLDSTAITDEGMAHLSRLSKLETLVMRNTDITDRGLTHLKKLTSLTDLNLYNTHVTSSGVASLEQALPDCKIAPTSDSLRQGPRDIALWPSSQKPISEELLRTIKGLNGSVQFDQAMPDAAIIAFELRNSDIPAESLLRLLAEMPEVERLSFNNLLVGDELAAGLLQCQKLTSLEFGNCRISDEGLKQIGKLRQLKSLTVWLERVSDQGLMELSELKALTKLSFLQTRVTLQDKMRLQRALPNCEIR